VIGATGLRLGLVGALSAICLWLPPTRVEADGVTWSSPVNLSGNTRHAWFPDIAADDAGNVHVVWAAEYPTPPRQEIDALWYTRGDGTTWTTPTDLAVIYIGDALRSALTVDSARRVHLLYRGFGQLEPQKTFDPPLMLGPEDLWYTSTLASDGGSVKEWLPSHKITRGTLGYYADLEIDSRGVLHAIWTEADSLGWGLYYANSTDGGTTWSEREALDDRNYVWWYRTHLNIDAQDRLHVTWEVTDRDNLGHTRAAFYAHSNDSGRTWAKVQMGGEVPRADAANSVAGPQQPTVGVDGTGQIVFVYREDDTNRIFYRTSTSGDRWSAAQLIPGVRRGAYRPYDVYDMVTDGAGHIHFAYVGTPDGSDAVSLMHSEWDGHGWSSPQVITSGAPYPEYPKLAISGGNRLHLVWFGGDRASIDRLAVGIWYSTAAISAPHSVNTAAAVPVAVGRSDTRRDTASRPNLPSLTRNRQLAPSSPGAAEAIVAGGELSPPSSLPLWLALAPVVFLLAAVVFAAIRSSKTRE
jgi:hypothetical protein